MEPSVQRTAREMSSLYVVPSLTLEDSDAAAYGFMGGIGEYLHQRLPEQQPRLFFAQGVALLSRQHLHFSPIEPTHPSLPLVHGEQALFVRQYGIIFGILAASAPIFSLHRLDQIAQYSGWLLYREEHVYYIPQDIPAQAEIKWKIDHELTARQREILTLLVRGYDAASIAVRLERNVRTIHSHCAKIYSTFDIHRIEDAIAIGRAAGLG